MLLHNVNQICKVKVFNFQLDYVYDYYPEITIFGFMLRRESFRFAGKELVPKSHHARVGNQIFYKPRVEIKMSNGENSVKYFDTLAEAIEYAVEIKSINPNIKAI